MRGPRDRFKRKLAITGVFVLLSSLMQVLLPPSAFAATCDTSTNLQVAWASFSSSQPTSYEGVKAILTDRNGYSLCTTDTGINNFTTVWTMINGSNGYAQSGTMFRWSYGYCVKRWAEQTTSSGGFVETFTGGCSIPGEGHYYWQQTVPYGSGWHVRSNIDQTTIAETPYNPFTVWHTPFRVTFSSETYYSVNTIPGTVSTPEDFNGLEVQQLSDDQWLGACGHVNLSLSNYRPTLWGSDAPSCSHVRSWQK